MQFRDTTCTQPWPSVVCVKRCLGRRLTDTKPGINLTAKDDTMSHLFSAPQMDSGMATVTERTDGYYWRRLNGAADEHGPFATRIDAIADMELDDEPDPDSGDLDQVEFGIDGAAWMDPETGHPAEAAILHVEEI